MFDTKEASSLLIFMLCLVSAALSSHSSSWTSWVGILVLAGFVLLGVFLFSSHHIVIPLATPALAGLNTYVKQADNFSMINLILSKEIYLPILMFIGLMILSLLIKKKFFNDRN